MEACHRKFLKHVVAWYAGQYIVESTEYVCKPSKGLQQVGVKREAVGTLDTDIREQIGGCSAIPDALCCI